MNFRLKGLDVSHLTIIGQRISLSDSVLGECIGTTEKARLFHRYSDKITYWRKRFLKKATLQVEHSPHINHADVMRLLHLW